MARCQMTPRQWFPRTCGDKRLTLVPGKGPQLFTDNISVRIIPKRTRPGSPAGKHESKRTKATLRRNRWGQFPQFGRTRTGLQSPEWRTTLMKQPRAKSHPTPFRSFWQALPARIRTQGQPAQIRPDNSLGRPECRIPRGLPESANAPKPASPNPNPQASSARKAKATLRRKSIRPSANRQERNGLRPIGRNGRNKVCAAAAKQQFRGKLVAPPAPRNIAHGTGRTRKIDEGQKARNPARGSVQDQSSNSGKRLLHKTKEQAAQPRECAATRTIRRPHSIKRKYVRSANHSASASDAPNQALKARPAVLTAHSNIARVDGATE